MTPWAKKVFLILLLPFLAYLLVYTWNARTGHLDRFATWTGLEAVGWVLLPGDWVERRSTELWAQYIDLFEAQQQNRRLRGRIDALRLENQRLRRKANEARRLGQILAMPKRPDWEFSGARVIGHRQGPNGILRTILIDAGSQSGSRKDLPVITPVGLVGRVIRVSPHFSTILLIQDPNSHIPVISQKTRTSGIAFGRGAEMDLEVKYIDQNSPLQGGELLLTSGLAGIFPKGVPVARVTSIAHPELSLFKEVEAKALLCPERLEEVLLLQADSLGSAGKAKAQVH